VGESVIQAERIEDFPSLFEWAGNYHRQNVYPRTVIERFAIGVYQIYQGSKYHHNAGYEAYAAASIHFIGAARMLKGDDSALLLLPPMIADVRFIGRALATEPILLNMAKAQQMVVYSVVYTGTHRESRFKPARLGTALARLVEALYGCIPVEQRADAQWDAMDIMSGRLKNRD
jgi:hypothetical protein